MSSIAVDYDSKRRIASLSADDDDAAWRDVTDMISEDCDEAVFPGGRVVEVPWWTFLARRKAVGELLQRLAALGKCSVTIGAEATAMLMESVQRERDWKTAAGATMQLTIHDISMRLEEAGFTRELKPFQMRNVQRLASLSAGATFSVPGSGKTSEALAWYAIKCKCTIPLTVIAPKNAFAAWEDEVDRCFGDRVRPPVRLVGGAAAISATLLEHPGIGLISYQQFARSPHPLSEALATSSHFLFLDESHRMKAGVDGAAGGAILAISHLPVGKLILSGTPMPNGPQDLVPQLRFLYPEVCVSEESIATEVRRVCVRTRKSELGLQPPHLVAIPVPMSPAQHALYDTLTSELALQLQVPDPNTRRRIRRCAGSVMRLLQAASNPSLLVDSEVAELTCFAAAAAETSQKLALTCKIVRRLAKQGKKAVVWSSFIGTVRYLAATLQDIGATYIDGSVETSEDETLEDSREARIRRFLGVPSCSVLVANPAACSEGISLHTVCHHAIYVDRTYNAAHFLQSQDRIHRLGLSPEQKTFVLILQSTGTIDASVQRRLQAKIESMSLVLEDPDLRVEPVLYGDEASGLTADDLDDLRTMLLPRA